MTTIREYLTAQVIQLAKEIQDFYDEGDDTLQRSLNDALMTKLFITGGVNPNTGERVIGLMAELSGAQLDTPIPEEKIKRFGELVDMYCDYGRGSTGREDAEKEVVKIILTEFCQPTEKMQAIPEVTSKKVTVLPAKTVAEQCCAPEGFYVNSERPANFASAYTPHMPSVDQARAEYNANKSELPSENLRFYFLFSCDARELPEKKQW